MPRLLLVDDNPSIHKIAETLLAASDVTLVSCGSGAQALALIEQGDHFDVALLDTSMAGMDGWALLQRLRETEATARMPVAMMAGVLDLVDPAKLLHAPIQGFLKKPVELRDLADRVKRLLDTPVLPPAPVPPPQAPVASELGITTQAEDDLLLLGPGDLAEEAPEAEAAAVPPAIAQPSGPAATGPGTLPFPDNESLDLEELDLESLRGLTFSSIGPVDEAPGAGSAPAEAAKAPAPAADPGFTVPEFLLADTLPDSAPDLAWEGPDYAGSLPDLGPAAGGAPAPAAAQPGNALGQDEFFDWSDESDSLVGMALADRGPGSEPRPDIITLSDILDPPAALEENITPTSLRLEETGPGEGAEAWPVPDPGADAPAAAATPVPTAPMPPAPMPVPAAPAPEALASTVPAPFYPAEELAADGLPAATLQETPAGRPQAGADPLQALLDDPVLMDRLAKALVARLGDQVLREIAWEVMPELAARLNPGDRP